MFSKDNLKRLAEQAQKAGNRLATNAGGTSSTWFAGQISPEKGDNLEELAELSPEQAVAKLQRQNARLRRKAEAAMNLEQENANLKSQLQEVANQMATKVAEEMSADTAKPLSSPDKAIQLLEAKVEMLHGNLTTARQELEESAGLKQQTDRLQAQLKAAGLEPDTGSVSTSPSSATELPMSTRPAAIASTDEAADQEQPSPGQVSPSQISPFQSIAMQEPGQSWMQSPSQSAEGYSQSEGLQSGLQSAEPSALFSASAVAQLQQQNAALKAELAQLTQRKAAEEADVAGQQSQNRTLIGEVEKLRLQVGEARHKLADSKVAAGTAEKQRKELDAQLELSRAEVANLKSQQAESQQSHEEELQSLRHTMQLVSEQMRTAQKEFDSNLKASAAKLSALKADSEQKSEELARQLGESDFALRQLRGQLETAMLSKGPESDNSQQQMPLETDNDTAVYSLTKELHALKKQHDSAVLRHESTASEHDDVLKQHLAHNSQLKQNMTALQTRLSSTEQQLVQSQDAVGKLESELQSRTTVAGETQSQLKTQLSELQQQLQHQGDTVSKQQVGSEDAKAAIEKELQAAQAVNKQLVHEVSNLKMQLGQSRHEAQQATDAVSDQRQQLQDSQEALTTSQLQLAEASSSQQQLQSHFIELQLQAAESAAQHSNLQIALKASEDKLAASETELGESQAQVATLQQDLQALQQELKSSRTANEQIGDQLQEALNDKSMLQSQLEALLSNRGQADSNVTKAEHKEDLLQELSPTANQNGTPAVAKDSSNVGSAEDTVPDRPPAESTQPVSQSEDNGLSRAIAARQSAEGQLDQALKDKAKVESQLAQALQGTSASESQPANALTAQQTTDSAASQTDSEEGAEADCTQAKSLLQESQAELQRLQEQAQQAKQAQTDHSQQLTGAIAAKHALEQQLQGVSTQANKCEQELQEAGRQQHQLQQQLDISRSDLLEAQQQLKQASGAQDNTGQQLSKLQAEQAQWQHTQKSLEAAQSKAEEELSVLQGQETAWQRDRQMMVTEQEQLRQQLAALQAQETSWQEDRQSLRERCERLQKTNQQRRTQLQEAQQAAAEADKVRTQLAASRSDVSSLKAEVMKSEELTKEMSSLRQALEQAEDSRRALSQQSKREQASLERQLQTAGKNRDQLAEQVALLSPVAATNDALHAQLSDLRKDLQQAQASAALLPQETTRAEEAQAKSCRLEAEAASTSGQMSKLEDQLCSTEQKLQEAQEAVTDAKQAHAELARSYQDEMEGLANKAPSAWPSHVRQLVESRERVAIIAAEAAAHAEAETTEAEFGAEAESLRQTASECRSKQQQAQAQMLAAQARVTAIGVELEQRETSLRQQLQMQQATAAADISKLSSEVVQLTHELDTSMAEARSEGSEWQDKWQQAVKELADVKERAWSLLEEKDLQLQALKAGRPPSTGRSNASRASSHASFSRRSSASGALAPAQATARVDTSEIQPARSVSEDSDSEGGTLFQPIEFREHVQGENLQQPSTELPVSSRSTILGAAASEAGTDSVAALKQKVVMLEQELADSERTHQLRDKAAEVLKEEVAMLHRSDARGSVNVDYVKNVLLNGFESGELSNDTSLVPVLSRLLHFSPAEIERIKQAKPPSMKKALSRTFLTRLTSQ